MLVFVFFILESSLYEIKQKISFEGFFSVHWPQSGYMFLVMRIFGTSVARYDGSNFNFKSKN